MKALVIRIDDAKYLIDIDVIDRIMPQESVTKVPDSKPYIDGILDYDNKALKIINFRKLLGLKTLDDFTKEYLLFLKQTHTDWIDALKDSINNGTKFNKIIDPTECDLGKRIESFSNCLTCNKDFKHAINTGIKEDHSLFHQIAITALKQNDKTKAQQIIDEQIIPRHKKILQDLDYIQSNIHLVNTSSQRVIILNHNDSIFGLIVDNIDKIVEFNPDNFVIVKASAKVSKNLNINKSIILNDEILMYVEFKDTFLI